MNLLNLLMGSMTNDSSLNALSGKTGLSNKSLNKLLVAAIPLLLKFLTKNAGKQGGAQSLLSALGGHKDTRSMAQQIEAADADDGAKILNHIFGGEKEAVLSSLAKESDLDNSQVSAALSNMAPALMSGLSAATTSASKVDLSDGLDLSDLMGMFGGASAAPQQSSGLLGGLLGGGSNTASQGAGLLGSLLGGGSSAASSQASSGLGSLLGGLLGGGAQQEQVQESSFDGGDLLGMLSSLMK